MHTWYTHKRNTGRLHLLRTPQHSAVRRQPTNQTGDSQSPIPPKTKFPKPNQAPKIIVPFPGRILQSPQVKTLIPKVMCQLNIPQWAMPKNTRQHTTWWMTPQMQQSTCHQSLFVTYVRTWVYLRMSNRRCYVCKTKWSTRWIPDRIIRIRFIIQSWV